MAVIINGTTGSISLALPPGMVMYFANQTAPGGWLECNGTAVSRLIYDDLFDAIGTVYGAGDGITTFNLPDLRGEFVRGWDNGRGVDPTRAIGSSQTDAFQGHYHVAAGLSGGSQVPSYGAGVPISVGAQSAAVAITDGTNGTPRTASETRPRNVAMMACIKF